LPAAQTCDYGFTAKQCLAELSEAFALFAHRKGGKLNHSALCSIELTKIEHLRF
jgi:hypothetical protein